MIVQVMAISNLVLTRQIYSEKTNGAHAHYCEPVPLSFISVELHIRSNYSLTQSIKLIVMLIQLRDILQFQVSFSARHISKM